MIPLPGIFLTWIHLWLVFTVGEDQGKLKVDGRAGCPAQVDSACSFREYSENFSGTAIL